MSLELQHEPTASPQVPGSTDWERFDNADRKVLSVYAEAIQREKERMDTLKAKKKRPVKPSRAALNDAV